MTSRTCSFEGCGGPHSAKGLCSAHYSQQARGVPLRPVNRNLATNKGKVCAYESCIEWAKTSGLCGGHYQQRLRGEDLRPLSLRGRGVKCSVDGCEEGYRFTKSGQPLCNKHHLRWKLKGDPTKLTAAAVRPRGLAAVADAVAGRDRSACWTDWADLPCWEGLDGYGGKYDSNGYPCIGSTRVMHLSLESDGRPRPPAPANYGLHSCDDTRCWNPDHLRWGTNEENAKDVQDSRNYCRHCEHCNPA